MLKDVIFERLLRIVHQKQRLSPDLPQAAGPAADASAAVLRRSSRRRFLARISGATVATVAAAIGQLPGQREAYGAAVEGDGKELSAGEERRWQAYRMRERAASLQRDLPLPAHPENGDEALYANHLGSFSKGLPHNDLGEVDQQAYRSMIYALRTGKADHFDTIVTGGNAKLRNPQHLQFRITRSGSPPSRHACRAYI